MKKSMKKELKKAFLPPAPKEKESFLAAISYPKLSYPEFVLSQIGYISKIIWIFSLAVVLSGVAAVNIAPDNKLMLIWIISALIPFLAVLTAAEISRSDVFGMSEIESGCRFSLQQLIGARMIILGICNFAVIAITSVVLDLISIFGIAKAALYIFTPYVLTNGISIAVLGRVRGQEGLYLSASAAVGVSLAGVILSKNIFLGKESANILLTVIFIAGAVMMAVQNKKLLMGKDKIYGTQN